MSPVQQAQIQQGQNVGEMAPDISLQNDKGEMVTLSTLLKAGPVMLTFYPGDFTPVCTAQLCSYRDAFADFKQYGVQVIGISSDDESSHKKFTEKYKLPFPLFTDVGHQAGKKLGCTSLFMLGAVSRSIVIIGKEGKILYKHVEALPLTRRKPEELLSVVKDLKQKGAI
jgi:peroxiredoxin Q/BCP